MRKLLLVVAVVFVLSVISVAVSAATYKCPTKPTVRHKVTVKHRMTTKKKMAVRCPVKKKRSMPARTARGPMVTCPSPVVNVPQQAAPIVNVPQQPAPVVNIPPEQPGVGVTTDAANIYVVRGNQLIILDKRCYEVRNTVTLPSVP